MLIFFDNKKQKYIWRIVLVTSIVLGLICNKLFGGVVYEVFVGFSVFWTILGNFILKLFRIR